MFKKLVITALVVLAGVFLLGKTEAGQKVASLAETYWKKAGKAIDKKVPPEVEIERIRAELGKRNKEINKQINVLAEEMVAVENLRKDVAAGKENLKNQLANVMQMKKDLEAGEEFIRYGETKYSASRIKDKLARDWASYKRCEESVKSKEKLLEAREAALVNAKEQIIEMKSQYEQLEVALAQLETDVKALNLAKTRSKVALDDSHLARIKEATAKLRDRIDAEVLATEMKNEFARELDIKVEKKTKSADVLKEIDEYFNKTDAKAVERP